MFAVIKTGGKQYKVAPEDVITVEKLKAEAGETVELRDVLMVGGDGAPQVGTPLVDGATVAAEVVEQTRGGKIIVFKKKRRKNYRRTHGHRQDHTVLRITEILTGGKKPSKKAAARKPEPEKAGDASGTGEKAEAKTEEKRTEARPAKTAEADDLKQIQGIGPEFEKKPHGLGITSPRQVADFTPEQVAEVGGKLDFKGRIERDGWIGQAKALVAADA